ncbi:ketoacyl-ACP synthase III [Tumebacillus sp. ITR2]|uniref:Beta-ketoacyl-[acyl-carrier-protein] synthase III n=1 Tax=Tumebacillus amylolyticus TaxID=2801339 RepID=A0ABS1JGM5_9BACL|nr:ketoacyl-ACP synthase III [Tumebacillus amylolyticus]MBL0389438.1 ketoacyl-ACP synthase III [Tumebacillus amylolyticus]
MSQESRAGITALGVYTPERVLSNADLEQMVETSDEWIVQRTGMRERRIAAPDEFTSDLCVAAVQQMIETYNVSVEDVDLILVSTTTPDYPFPSVASQVQAQLQIPNAGALDISAACAGFVYALHMANGLITSGLHRKVLVIGAETLSKVVNAEDRTTSILFGDGAGVALVEWEEHNPSFLYSHLGSEGAGGKSLYRTGLSSRMGDLELLGDGKIVQNGREVFKWAVNTIVRDVPLLVEKAGLSLDDIDWFVPHSANLRIIEASAERLKFPMEKTLHSLEYFGNTSSATIPLALQLGLQEGKIQNGDTILLYGFGGGLVYAGMVLRWTI